MMHLKLYKKMKRMMEDERGVKYKHLPSKIQVALIYPNTYWVGMSNLGFQSVYQLLNERKEISCERAFLPDTVDMQKPLFTMEGGRFVKEFDVVAFSISFELDYLNIPKILRLSKIEVMRERREEGDPIIIGGGAAVMINPEPIADFIDVFIIGEAEEGLYEVFDVLLEYRELPRTKILYKMSSIDGVYVPGVSKKRARRRWVKRIDAHPTSSCIVTPHTEFANQYLIEVTRGCGEGCRFCAAGFLYRPFRYRALESIVEKVREGLTYTKRIGLVGSALSDYPHLEELCERINHLGGEVSLSSLRFGALSKSIIETLNQDTITFAPDGGSRRLRGFINKEMEMDEILRGIALLKDKRIKLYLLVGLPGEDEEDLQEFTEFVNELKSVQEVIISVNPFIPKPHTPFQFFKMEDEKTLKKRMRYLKKNLRGVKIVEKSVRLAKVQTILSRGGRELGRVLHLMVEEELNFFHALKRCALTPEDYLRDFSYNETLPWDSIDPCFPKEYLIAEHKRALDGIRTPPCQVGCSNCGVCANVNQLSLLSSSSL